MKNHAALPKLFTLLLTFVSLTLLTQAAFAQVTAGSGTNGKIPLWNVCFCGLQAKI